MWILSQNKKLLINTDVISYDEVNGCICSNNYVLGRYKSAKQIEQIFKTLVMRLRKPTHVIENVRNDYIVHDYVPEVYEMPEEEEN